MFAQVCFSLIWFSPKVKCRVVDFFAMALSPLSKVNIKYVNESVTFSSG